MKEMEFADNVLSNRQLIHPLDGRLAADAAVNPVLRYAEGLGQLSDTAHAIGDAAESGGGHAASGGFGSGIQ